MKKWEYEGNFLDNFDVDYRGSIGNIFCTAIRHIKDSSGFLTFDVVRGLVLTNLRERLKATYGIDPDGQRNYQNVLIALNNNAGEDFVEHLIWRESLSDDEKRRLKAEAQKVSVNRFMESQPPSEKQLSYLKSLGCPTVPKTKLEASEIISQLVKTK